MGCTEAVLIAECRELLKGLKNASPLGSEKAQMSALKNLVTKTKGESLFKTDNKQADQQKQKNQQQQRRSLSKP